VVSDFLQKIFEMKWHFQNTSGVRLLAYESNRVEMRGSGDSPLNALKTKRNAIFISGRGVAIEKM